jgi:hypothetical protein
MNNRTIFGAMGVAVIVLVAAGLYLVFFSGDGGASGPPGSISTSENCSKYRIENQRNAEIRDPFVKGVVDIGFVEGYKVTEAAALLKTLGTATYMPIAPYRQNAFICVKKGYEAEWVARMKTYAWVEFAHVEGVNPIDTLGD